jgi:Xaa-Pro aminopeptidase
LALNGTPEQFKKIAAREGGRETLVRIRRAASRAKRDVRAGGDPLQEWGLAPEDVRKVGAGPAPEVPGVFDIAKETAVETGRDIKRGMERAERAVTLDLPLAFSEENLELDKVRMQAENEARQRRKGLTAFAAPSDRELVQNASFMELLTDDRVREANARLRAAKEPANIANVKKAQAITAKTVLRAPQYIGDYLRFGESKATRNTPAASTKPLLAPACNSRTAPSKPSST